MVQVPVPKATRPHISVKTVWPICTSLYLKNTYLVNTNYNIIGNGLSILSSVCKVKTQ